MSTARYIDGEAMRCVLAALTPANRTICRVMLHTGLRVGDVVALRAEQIAGRMLVREAKTGKRRRVSLPRWLVDEIRAGAGEDWAFPGRRPGQHRTRQAVWADMRRAAKAFRFRGTVSPHTARKVYAVSLMRKYGDIARVQRILGHDNPAVTMLYALADALPNNRM